MRSMASRGDPPALRPELRTPIGVAAVLAAVVGAVLAGCYFGGFAAGRLDTWAGTAVQDLWSDPGLGALVIDFVGETVPAVVLAALLAMACLALGRLRLAVVAIVGLGSTGVVTTVLKPVVGRTINGGFLAYPSGHTAAATALALVAMLLLVDLLWTGKLPGVLLVLGGVVAAGVAMALSQIALNAHYPTDTVGGFCAALAVVPATAWLVDRIPGQPGTADPTGR